MELFHAIGVALAPLARSGGPVATCEHFEIVGIVPFSAPKSNGTLMLSLHDAVFGLFAPPVAGDARKSDVLRELTNQLVGRIKNRLMQFQVTLRVGLPSVMRKQLLSQRSSTAPNVCYRFRTLRGEIMVTLEGTIHNEPLNYSSRVRVAKEGDFIVF